ncbi:MAG: 50S ribosomal protein P1 [Thaumarchaeota archaeon]|nr:50S ribosomal protein P1 [Nitrososphaerota archaeon]
MEYVYAALLLHKLQKEVNEENVSSVVKASGVEVNPAQVKALIAALADVNIDEAIKAAPVAAAAPAAEASAAGGDEKKDKAEKKADAGKSEEQALEGLSSLFG